MALAILFLYIVSAWGDFIAAQIVQIINSNVGSLEHLFRLLI